jgi:Short C-terminal domain
VTKGGTSQRPVRRAIAVVVLGLSVVAGAAAITLVSLIMRSVTAIGGSCADSGPYVSAQPCPSGTGTALLLVFANVAFCIIGGLWAAAALQAPQAIWLGWPALFLTLGWNFLEDGFEPPTGESIAGGFVVCGVVFVLMGVGPLLLWASVLKDTLRSGRAKAGVPAPARAPVSVTPATGTAPVAGRLERLAALHASGELTDEEYTRAKQATLRGRRDR